MASPRIITARSIGLAFRANKSPMGPEREVTGHYSGTPRVKNWRAGIATAKSFHQSHLDQGWSGIGYHFLIPDDGSIICCRPVLFQGSHVLKQNDQRVGVNMPGTTGDRPTRRQAMAFNWLLHHAHTDAMAGPHRTDIDLSTLPIFGHKEVPGQSTACPGLFLGMFKRGGAPFRDEAFDNLESIPGGDDYLDPFPEDEESVEDVPDDPAADEAEAIGPDEDAPESAASQEAPTELPEADPAFDQDLESVVREIEASRR